MMPSDIKIKYAEQYGLVATGSNGSSNNPQKTTKMKAYFLYAGDPCDGGFAFVEPSSYEARKHRNYVASEIGCDFIDVRCVWIRGANVDGLLRGEIDATKDAIKRKIYAAQDFEDRCDLCNKYDYLYLSDDEKNLICSDCGEKEQQ